jgi:hypothetical protein
MYDLTSIVTNHLGMKDNIDSGKHDRKSKSGADCKPNLKEQWNSMVHVFSPLLTG